MNTDELIRLQNGLFALSCLRVSRGLMRRAHFAVTNVDLAKAISILMKHVGVSFPCGNVSAARTQRLSYSREGVLVLRRRPRHGGTRQGALVSRRRPRHGNTQQHLLRGAHVMSARDKVR